MTKSKSPNNDNLIKIISKDENKTINSNSNNSFKSLEKGKDFY
jgi:hypothetical protein